MKAFTNFYSTARQSVDYVKQVYLKQLKRIASGETVPTASTATSTQTATATPSASTATTKARKSKQ